LLLLIVPPLDIYFDLQPMSLTITPLTWGFYYAGFYAMQILLAWFVVGSFRWETLTLATASFPIYTKALWNVIAGKDVGWHVTGSASSRSPFNFIVPQLLVFVFLALTSVVAVSRDLNTGSLSLATAWNVTNTLILALFVAAAVREGRPRAVAPQRPPVSVSPTPRTIVARPPSMEPHAPARRRDAATPVAAGRSEGGNA
jgi:cellulose synthase (UDP-forming)